MATHDEMAKRYLHGLGVEIGAFQSPIPGIQPVYIDKFESFDGQDCRLDFRGDADRLPVAADSLDYVASSHVLEHTANPVAALLEWQRVLKPGGVVYCVIPDYHFTFDRHRRPTSARHMIDDYRAGTDDVDATHIDDFIDGIDWREIRPDLDEAEIRSTQEAHRRAYHAQVKRGEGINIHFHVFDSRSFRGLIAALQRDRSAGFKLELIEIVERFPDEARNGFLAVLRKKGRDHWGHRVRHWWRGRGNADYPFDPAARAKPNET